MYKKKLFLQKILIILLTFLIGALNVTQCLGASYKKDESKIQLTTIDDFHDVGIKSITSPSNPFNKFKLFSLQDPEVYIQPGTEDIEVIVENNGTFPEYDLTCYVEIYEYITDPENGTLAYEDEITGIDLDEPNGGTKLLNFKSNTFPDEGIYKLFVDLPLEIDDFPENNQKELNIVVDDTEPASDYPPIFDPPEPDGWNGWYLSDVNVTLSATDDMSGVKEIRYTIDSGAEQVISGSNGSFVLTEEGYDILVEYWAIDNAGNVETPKNSFTIDIDQMPPDVSLTYEVIGGNPWQGWEFEFTLIATDEMSGICKVEIYYNDELQYTFEDPGPEYAWTFRLGELPESILKVIVYDCAGNRAEEIIDLSYLFHTVKINGPRFGRPGIEYEYTFKIKDSDESDYLLLIDWGDGTFTDWAGPYESEETAKISHSWPKNGTYEILARAKSINGTEYGEGHFKTFIPREKRINNLHFNYIIKRCDLFIRLLNFIKLKLF